jgi:carbon-monoxide dehydrogenase large subunit
MAFAVIVRSRNAHGKIRKLDVTAAKKMPGVLAVYTGTDLANYGVLKTVMPLKQRDGSTMEIPVRHALAEDKVRFVGDPVACVVAETLYQAKDAAEAVELDVDPLPAVTEPREAAKPGAPLVYDNKPGNIAADWHFGDSE